MVLAFVFLDMAFDFTCVCVTCGQVRRHEAQAVFVSRVARRERKGKRHTDRTKKGLTMPCWAQRLKRARLDWPQGVLCGLGPHLAHLPSNAHVPPLCERRGLQSTLHERKGPPFSLFSWPPLQPLRLPCRLVELELDPDRGALEVDLIEVAGGCCHLRTLELIPYDLDPNRYLESPSMFWASPRPPARNNQSIN
jgi:hypothetical protein